MTDSLPDFLTLSDLLDVAEGVLPRVDIRDIGLLESAAARPQTTVFGDLAYPDILAQAAALMHSLVRNHPLVDGNKRLAWSATRVFLLINGRDVSYDIDDAEAMVLNAAKGDIDVEHIAKWLRSHVQ